ncbi:hypothetical protein Hanom_Chr12g01165251 [Helianthus anomalus]
MKHDPDQKTKALLIGLMILKSRLNGGWEECQPDPPLFNVSYGTSYLYWGFLPHRNLLML